MIQLKAKNRKINAEVNLTTSKSECNRALIIQALCSSEFEIRNPAAADDTHLLRQALKDFSKSNIVDVHHAGTAYRFLTVFLAAQSNGEWLLTGSSRMRERPIGVLVDALKMLGADISYEEKKGYPPLKIIGNGTLLNDVTINAGVSSQYISALLLIAPTLKNGLHVTLEGKLTSRPYLMMTLRMMEYFGVIHLWEGDQIRIKPQSYEAKDISIEADWSAASYWYSIVALSEIGTEVKIKGLNHESLQGDAVLKNIYDHFGVKSVFENDGWRLIKNSYPIDDKLILDLNEAPDIAQTILCTCAGLKVGAQIKGLHTLKIKETNRVEAMKIELAKFGLTLEVMNDDEVLFQRGQDIKQPKQSIATYQDHRMAMAFAPLCLVTSLNIENEEVVSKSYPDFWKDIQSVGLV